MHLYVQILPVDIDKICYSCLILQAVKACFIRSVIRVFGLKLQNWCKHGGGYFHLRLNYWQNVSCREYIDLARESETN